MNFWDVSTFAVMNNATKNIYAHAFRETFLLSPRYYRGTEVLGCTVTLFNFLRNFSPTLLDCVTFPSAMFEHSNFSTPSSTWLFHNFLTSRSLWVWKDTLLCLWIPSSKLLMVWATFQVLTDILYNFFAKISIRSLSTLNWLASC